MTASNPFNPETIVLALATVGMLLIALVSVGGFTVLAQRRLRSLGMLGAVGATDRNVRLVVRANGIVVGVAGTLLGAVIGLAAWLAYRPRVEANAHHVIGAFQLPWAVIGGAMALALVATYFAASRPARAITRVPIVTALSGRPAPPKQIHRSAVPGIVLAAAAAGLLAYGGRQNGGGGMPEILFGLVTLVAAVILLSPLCLAAAARLARRSPIAVRLALRDLARYRARSGSALAAISLGVLIAVLVCVLSAQRYGNVLDYAGPNVASNQLIVYTPNSPQGGGRPSGPVTGSKLQAMAASAQGIAAALGSHDVIQLETTTASLNHDAAGRNWNGPIYVATPQLLQAFGIKAVDPTADILSMRPGLSGLSKMQLFYGGGKGQTRQVTPGNGPRQPGGPGGPRADLVPVPGGQLPRQPKDSGGQRASERHVGPEHGDHRARHPAVQTADQHGRMAHPDAASAHRRADQECPAHRRRGRPDRGDQEQRAVVVGDHQLGDGVRDTPGAGHPRHERRPHPQRDGQ